MRSRRRYRRAILLFTPLVVAGALVWALGTTDPGRTLAVRAIESAVSGDDFSLRIDATEGSFFSAGRISRIEVGDGDGVWLTLEDVAYDWNPLSLVAGHLDVSRLSAARATVARQPHTGADSAPSDEPLSLPEIDVKRFEVGEIALDQQVLGAAARLSASGRARLGPPAEGLAGELEVNRLDGEGGRLSSSFAYRPGDEFLAVKLDAAEPAGGLAARLLDIEGLPRVSLSVDGEGTLDDWQANLALDAGGQPLAGGRATIAKADGGRIVTVDLGGDWRPLAPGRVDPLIGEQVKLDARALWADDGSVRIERAELTSMSLRADLAGVLDRNFDLVSVRGTIGLDNAGDAPVTLQLDDAETLRVDNASLRLDYDRAAPGKLDLDLKASGVAGAFGSATGLSVVATAPPGAAQDAPVWRNLEVVAEATGLALADAELASAAGDRATLTAKLTVFEDRLVAQPATLRLATGDVTFSGTLTQTGADGSYRVAVPDLTVLAALADMPLSGALQASAEGRIGFSDVSLALKVDGRTENLAVGVSQVDRLAAGALAFSGGVTRDASGALGFETLRLEGDRITADLDGSVTGEVVDVTGRGRIADLSAIDPSLAGIADFTGRMTGTPEAAEFEVTASGDAVTISGTDLESPQMQFKGSGPLAAPSGPFTLKAVYAGLPLAGEGRLAVAGDGVIALSDLDVSYATARATGQGALEADGVLSGNFALKVEDLSAFENLAGVELAGSLSADLELRTEDGTVSVDLTGAGEGVTAADASVGSVRLRGDVRNLLGTPVAEGTADLVDVVISGTQLDSVTLVATRGTDETLLGVDTSFMGSPVSARGTIAVDGDIVRVGLREASAALRGIEARLAEPTTVVIEGAAADLDNIALSVGGGRVSIDGRAGQTLDLVAQLRAIPASVANAFAPGLDVEGTVSGSVKVTGPASDPVIRYDLEGAGMTLSAARDAGVPLLSVNAGGEFAAGRVTVDGRATGAGGVSMRFDGTVPADGGALDLNVSGNVPLGLANPALTDRAAQVRGTANVGLKVAGSPADPRITGTVTTGDAAFADPGTGVLITDIRARARLDGNRLAIESLSGRTGKGTVTGSGSIGLDTGAGLPSDLKLRAENFAFNDGYLVSGRLDGDLTLSGPLLRTPTLSGTVEIERMDVVVPEELPGTVKELNVRHRGAPARVRRQIAARPRGDGGDEAFPVNFDLTVTSPNRIFVRGRGLDVLLGGRLRLTGTRPTVAGAFDMRKGTLTILARRLSFTRGRLDFVGDLDPQLDFYATTDTGEETVGVAVTGRASDPKFKFTATPDMPEDEALAQLIFNRSVDQLSPFQIASLASEINNLGGLSSGPGLLGQLRQSLGIDVLDVTTGDDGNPAVAAGSYVNDKVYLGVKQGAKPGSSRAVIELDVTKNIKARGEVGADGSSKLGLGVEWDY